MFRGVFKRMGQDALPMILSSVIALGLSGDVLSDEHTFTAKEKSWWAIQPVQKGKVPEGAQHPIDAYVSRKLKESGLKMAPMASAEEFIRRAFFDLHGLPPSWQRIETFRTAWNDNEQQAVEGLIDELLDSPRYGERWGQHWLDLVRYADSDGYREDGLRPSAYLYRDYVIQSLNDDVSYQDFVREQLAADEIFPNQPEKVVATGFLRNGVYEWNQRNAEMQREIMMNEITNVTSEVFLGLGMGCAQCHDHKFDPILQEDYYSLQAFLSSVMWPDDHPRATAIEVQEYERKRGIWEFSTKELRAEIEALLAHKKREKYELRVATFPAEVQAMFWKPKDQRSSYEEQIFQLVQRQAIREVRTQAKPEQILKKGSPEELRFQNLTEELKKFDHLKPEPLATSFMTTDTGREPAKVMIPGKDRLTVEPKFLTLLGGETPEIKPTPKTTGRRSALASWIVKESNPFASRVMVNRLWQYHFGRGLVASSNDFGMLGDPPSHPQLLDWLSSVFVEGSWKMKSMHRLMMTSLTYRQTARYEPSQLELSRDPTNKLLWRFPPTRLSAEQVRDAMLSISGELEDRDGGAGQNNETPVRTVYLKKMRNSPNPVMQCFDAPSGFTSEPSRQTTTTARQSLFLSNSEWPLARARVMAARILEGQQQGIGESEIVTAYRYAWGRDPSPGEISKARDFIRKQSQVIEATGSLQESFADFCHVLLNSNEFLYLH